MKLINYNKMNELKREYLDYNSLSGNKENMFCLKFKESLEHRKKKLSICLYLLENNFTIFTETISKDRKYRFDILAFDNKTGEGFIIEVVNSESEKSIEEKKKKYPCPPFNLIFCKISEEFKL